MFATEDGVARYNESAGQWLTEWTPGSGLPSDAGDQIYELWTDGTSLIVGSGEVSQFGQFRNGAISHWDGTTWTNYETGTNGVPNGYPITMTECAGIVHIGIYANNGGVARFDMANDSFLSTFRGADWNENYAEVSGVACDGTDTLYVAFYEDQADVKKYSYASNTWLNPITTANHNLPSDRVWWDAIDYSNSMLVLGHGIGTSGDNIIGGGYSAVATSGGFHCAGDSFNGQGSSVTSFQWLTNEWLDWASGRLVRIQPRRHHQFARDKTPCLTSPGLSAARSLQHGRQCHPSFGSRLKAQAQGFGQGGSASSGAGLASGRAPLADGTIDWQAGLDDGRQHRVAKDMELFGTDLVHHDNTDRALQTGHPHRNGLSATQRWPSTSTMDGLFVYGLDPWSSDLQGSSGSAAGVQLYDPCNRLRQAVRLLGGLPSNSHQRFR